MGHYQVSTHSGEHVEVVGGNWLVALGLGLDALGVVTNIDRLACEVLPGNTVIVRDVRTGGRFVVQTVPDSISEPLAELVGHNLLEDDDPLFAMDEDPDLATLHCSDAASVPEPRADSGHRASAGQTTHTDAIADLWSRFDHGTSRTVDAPSVQPGDPVSNRDPQIEALMMRLDDAASTVDAWRLALEGARRVCGAESGAALCQEADGALRFLFAAGPRAHEVRGRRLPPGQGIAGFCTQRDVGLLITEPSRDPRFFSRMDQATGYTTTAVLAVPVSTGFEMLGCLELLNAPSGFRHKHLEQLSALAIGLAARLIRDPE
ncbi:MAG: GAF domain-containing protein [Myxococcota bacterium]|nr:GAF domain-containing protein [Myxococcota bacterium]